MARNREIKWEDEEDRGKGGRGEGMEGKGLGDCGTVCVCVWTRNRNRQKTGGLWTEQTMLAGRWKDKRAMGQRSRDTKTDNWTNSVKTGRQRERERESCVITWTGMVWLINFADWLLPTEKEGINLRVKNEWNWTKSEQRGECKMYQSGISKIRQLFRWEDGILLATHVCREPF